MTIRTEPIGSIPRPLALIEALAGGAADDRLLGELYEEAVRDTIEQFEATGSPVITDGEQRKCSSATYCLSGLENLSPEGMQIPFADGHVRQLPQLESGPFRCQRHADTLARFSLEERQLIGIHTCPGGDRDSTHSADVDYAGLLPSLFELDVGNFTSLWPGSRTGRACWSSSAAT